MEKEKLEKKKYILFKPINDIKTSRSEYEYEQQLQQQPAATTTTNRK